MKQCTVKSKSETVLLKSLEHKTKHKTTHLGCFFFFKLWGELEEVGVS